MATRFTKPSINWAELEKRVPLEQKGKFLAFKGKSDAYLRRVIANPPEPPKINWEEYQKNVPIPGLVDKFKSAYESYQVPFPKDTLTEKVDEQWKYLQTEIKAFCAERQQEIELAKKEIEKLKALPNFEDMTMETFYDMYPEKALDPVNRPSFWPHNEEEQLWYKPPGKKDANPAGH